MLFMRSSVASEIAVSSPKNPQMPHISCVPSLYVEGLIEGAIMQSTARSLCNLFANRSSLANC
jgi:hypothetical protein